MKLKENSNKVVLITGSAGFVGFHLSNYLIKNSWNVIGIDNFSNYYDVNLKKNRHKILKKKTNFKEKKIDLTKSNSLDKILIKYNPSIIIHLAAQPGVRASLEKPKDFFDSNLLVTFNILQALKNFKIKHFLMASTSSVYGNSTLIPFDESTKTDYPLSFYAATKKANEVMAHSYSHLYKVPMTIFRFFTVYGPWGRPDMAYYKFTKSIINEEPIDIYNKGKMIRDFTYIDDLVKSIHLLIDETPLLKYNSKNKIEKDGMSSFAPYRIVNIGNSQEVTLMQFIRALEKQIGKKAIKNYLGMQQGDVKITLAKSDLLNRLICFRPNTTIEYGLKKFVEWYLDYHEILKK